MSKRVYPEVHQAELEESELGIEDVENESQDLQDAQQSMQDFLDDWYGGY